MGQKIEKDFIANSIEVKNKDNSKIDIRFYILTSGIRRFKGFLYWRKSQSN